MKYAKLFEKKRGIKLDLGCGSNKQGGYIGMDKRRLPTVDIVHDVRKIPYPIPDGACHTILMSHLWEHIPPDIKIEVMDELWRIMQVGGQLLISCPYATSFGANQDPTHYPCPNEATFTYWDPSKPLYAIYEPKPWRLDRNNWLTIGNMEVILTKILMNGKVKQ
jgi:SAM-dependent methyltransferase